MKGGKGKGKKRTGEQGDRKRKGGERWRGKGGDGKGEKSVKRKRGGEEGKKRKTDKLSIRIQKCIEWWSKPMGFVIGVKIILHNLFSNVCHISKYSYISKLADE